MGKNKSPLDDLVLDEDGNRPVDEKMKMSAADTKSVLAKKLIANIREELMNLEYLISNEVDSVDLEKLVTRKKIGDMEMVSPAGDGRMIEGVFDGQNMVGSDGRQYLVPQNYASKSKLVEGDILKLTIQQNGGFLFKQIGPIERERVVGSLMRDENTQDWKVVAEGKKYSVLPASVSYFKGQVGDQVVSLIPKAAPSRWAAVENIIHQE